MDKRTILLVEDNPDDVELTLRALKKNNILNEVVVAKDGVEALDYLFGTGIYAGRDTSNVPAVILLNLKLPRVSGMEVLQRLRADRRTKLLPVVVLTSSKEEKDLIDSYKLGANSYIRKPVDFTKFVEAVKDLGLYWVVLNEPPPAGRSQMGKKIHVLIVEDSEDDALLMVRELRRSGYEPIFERVDTAEAMSKALKEKAWDTVISDYVTCKAVLG